MKRSSQTELSRRAFIKNSAGVLFTLALPTIAQSNNGAKSRVAIGPWVHIAPDGTITIYNPVAEMGQGSGTALPLIVAEEMDADWERVVIEDSPVDSELYGHPAWGIGPIMLTVGSVAVSDYFDSLRIAGAQVRHVLLTEAARRWNTDINALETAPGMVVNPMNGEQLSFGELAASLQAPVTIPEIGLDSLKKASDYRLIGKSVQRFDVPSKVDGSAIYSIDVDLEGMLLATIERSPVPGATATINNLDEIKSMPGVVKVPIIENGVGVIAQSYYLALQAKRALKIDWQGGDALGVDSDAFLAEQTGFLQSSIPADEVDVAGDIEGQQTERRIEATYHNEFVYHAQIEPLNAVVRLSPDRTGAEVWVGTQVPDRVQRDAARALNLEQPRWRFIDVYWAVGSGVVRLATT